MATGQKKVNIYLKKFLPQQQMVENFLDYLRNQDLENLKLQYPLQGFFFGNSIAGIGSDELRASTPSLATNGQGDLLKLDPTNADFTFENENAIPYHVGMRYNVLERGTEINVRTGQIEYTFFKDTIGEKGEPSSVLDNGSTLTVNVDSIFEAGVDHKGRKCIVYLKRPVGQADAFYEGVVEFVGGFNVVNTTHLIGQTAGLVSSDPADYTVFAPGPTVRRNTNLSLDPLYVYFGIVTGGGAGTTPLAGQIDTSLATVLYGGGSFSTLVDMGRSFLVGGGAIAWDLANDELSWSADLRIKLASRPFDYQMVPTTITLLDGECFYIDADGIVGGIKAPLISLLSAVPDVVEAQPVAIRIGNDIFFRDGALELEGDTVENTVTTGRLDGITKDTLDYMGAKNESDSTPDYRNATGSVKENIHLTDNDNLTKAIKNLELRDDVVTKVRVIDFLSTVLPDDGLAVTPNIDGQVMADGDRVLFVDPALNGVYQLSGVGVAVAWLKLPVFSGGLVPVSMSLIGVQDSADEFIRTVYQWTAANSWKPLDSTEIQGEPTGFIKRTDSEISFVNGTRTFTIDVKAPSTYFYYGQKGRIFRKETSQDVIIPDAEGLHFIYFDGAVLTSTQVFNEDIVLAKTFVATVYWNIADQESVLLADERHGLAMDGTTHLYLHLTNGCQYNSGLAIGGTVAGTGALDADAQVTVDSGVLFDEDLKIDIVDDPTPSENFEQILSPIAQIPVYYKSGALGNWKRDAATNFALKAGTARPAFNELQAGPLWATPDASLDGKFIAMYIIGTNDINNPVIAIMGQREDDTLALAQQNNTLDTLNLDGLPTLEFKALFRVLYETDSTYANTIKAKQVEFTDLRFAETLGAGGGISPTDHNALSGRNDAGSHPSQAISTTPTDFGGAGSGLDLNAKSILKSIDDHFKALRIHAHPTLPKRVILTGASVSLNTGTVLEQTLKNLIVKFDGLQIDFSTGEIFEDDGVTPYNSGVNDFTPVIPPVGQDRWAGLTLLPATVNVDNTINLQPLVLISESDDFRGVFASGIKVGQIKLQEDTAALADIAQTDITQQGVGGGGGDGAGDANSFLEDLKRRASIAFWRFFTPFIFATQEDQEEDSVNTTAAYDIANGEYDFDISEILATIQQLGSRFLGTSSTLKPEADHDLAKVEVWALYTEGSEDPAPVVRASRDGRNEFQVVPMFQHGNSPLWIGEHVFDEEAANQNLHELAVAEADTQAIFTDSGAGAKRAFRFVVTDKEAQKNLTLYLQKTGSPLGKARINIIKDDTSLPSTDPALKIGSNVSGDDIDIAALAAGNNVSSIPIGRVITRPGTYWVEIITDQDYKDSYVAATDELGLRVDSAGAEPDGAVFDDGPGTWAGTASEAAVYLLEGMQFDLRIEIEASQNDVSLKAMATFYSQKSTQVQSGLKLRHVERFDASTNPTEFTIPGGKFLPDIDQLEVFDVSEGKVYKYPAFGVDGHKITFPANTFLDVLGVDVMLIFDQSKGVGFDNSDVNANLMASNRLGSTDPTLDKSIAGEGILQRADNGQLIEISWHWNGVTYEQIVAEV